VPGTTLGTFLNIDGQPKMDNFQLARKVFTQSGANLEEINLQVWGQISNTVDTEEQLKEKYRILAQALGFDSLQPVVQKEKDGFLILSNLMEREDSVMQLVMQAIPAATGYGGSCLGLSFRTTDVTVAQVMYGNISAALARIGSEHQVGVVWTGSLPGKLSTAKRSLLAQSLAETVEARFVEGMEEEQVTSLTYYTNQGQGFLTVNKQKLNINIALRFHADKGSTYIHVGSPLIYQEY
ncbi:MAG: YwmB family TATA-box binding protein, partial [Bacillota bacterium]